MPVPQGAPCPPARWDWLCPAWVLGALGAVGRGALAWGSGHRGSLPALSWGDMGGLGGDDRIGFQSLESSRWVEPAPVLASAQPIPWDHDPHCCVASQPRDSSAGALGPSLTPPTVPHAMPAALGVLN